MTENEVEDIRELEQYREIGTLEACKVYKNIANLTIKNACLDMQIIDELREYKNIGTVEECREAMEQRMPKKPTPYMQYEGKCVCGAVFLDRSTGYCGNCGKKLDWSE